MCIELYLDPEQFCHELPDLGTFHRPLWAYAELEDGMNILRRALFGNTDLLIDALNQRGTAYISDTELRQIIRHANVFSGIHPVLICKNGALSAIELADWYQAWEDQTLEAYYRNAREKIYAQLGH